MVYIKTGAHLVGSAVLWSRCAPSAVPGFFSRKEGRDALRRKSKAVVYSIARPLSDDNTLFDGIDEFCRSGAARAPGMKKRPLRSKGLGMVDL
ncbi:MAG: hypothetical protein Q4D31_00005, partial [Eubacteriales bacterium]|nr:hypothetical protein [Eubacteriales bacterium]